MDENLKGLRASIRGVAAAFAQAADTLPEELVVTREFSTPIAEQVEVLADQLTAATAASEDRPLLLDALYRMQVALAALEARIVELERSRD